MKIKYEFVTGAVEVEVTDDWGTILVDLDRQEYNINHKETRRHCSLDAYNLDDTLFPSDVDVLRDILRAEDAERLYSAIAKLEPRQQKLSGRCSSRGAATPTLPAPRASMNPPSAMPRPAL